MAVYKIMRSRELAAFVTAGWTAGSPDDRTDGFIHLSSAAQAPGTAARHFTGEADLWLVACDPAPLGSALRWEPSRRGELFPHLYRPLTRADVAWIRPLLLEADAHVFPELS